MSINPNKIPIHHNCHNHHPNPTKKTKRTKKKDDILYIHKYLYLFILKIIYFIYTKLSNNWIIISRSIIIFTTSRRLTMHQEYPNILQNCDITHFYTHLTI